jgi:hypothetical protein
MYSIVELGYPQETVIVKSGDLCFITRAYRNKTSMVPLTYYQ